VEEYLNHIFFSVVSKRHCFYKTLKQAINKGITNNLQKIKGKYDRVFLPDSHPRRNTIVLLDCYGFIKLIHSCPLVFELAAHTLSRNVRVSILDFLIMRRPRTEFFLDFTRIEIFMRNKT